MKKMPSETPSNSEDELLSEYHFDYKRAKPNRFDRRSEKQQTTVVVLDEYLAQFFPTSEAVNRALRVFLEGISGASK